MSTPRLIRELTMLIAAAGGAVIGYAAGQRFESSTHVILAFVGMSVAGAFADFCLRGGKY